MSSAGISIAVLVINPVVTGLKQWWLQLLLQVLQVMLQSTFVQSNELLAEVKVWSIGAIEDCKAVLALQFLDDGVSSMHWGIVIEEHILLSLVGAQSLHFDDCLWYECKEVFTLDGVSSDSECYQLGVSDCS